MTLPLPFTITDPVKGDAVQNNFDTLAQEFPLSRKAMAIETPHVVGAAGEPAFLNSWVAFGSGYQTPRFWKDPMGIVHIEGLIKSGTPSATSVVFTLPARYRPASTLLFSLISNDLPARVDVKNTGDVLARLGSAVYFTLSGIAFKQEL